jgi:REP element-mobilizing transposase RayT
MPRKTRIDAPGALHHIICRGIERKRIFRDDKDRDSFLGRLGNILVDSSTSCFAWALIPNHFHLLLRTGAAPIATVMRRLLTGYAVTFNHRYGRHGQLFQNRYKSILCEEETYLLELVRYIHLNPVRARLVTDVDALEQYPFSGHAVLIGESNNDWQDTEYILARFGENLSGARQKYRQFLHEGVEMGKRPELTGGGLIRSLGGWKVAKKNLNKLERLKGDERILGDNAFVDAVLRRSEEELQRRDKLKLAGYGLDELAKEVAGLFDIEPGQIYSSGKYPRVVQARSLFCYRGVRELGLTATFLAKKLHLSQPAVSIAAKRGEKIAQQGEYALTKTRKL